MRGPPGVEAAEAEQASIAQLAEHALSKRKVASSILAGGFHIRVGVVGNISACHADAPGSIPGRGVFFPPVVHFGAKPGCSIKLPGYEIPTRMPL